jgi:hypothetical protein
LGVVAYLYDLAWRKVRGKRNYRPLDDELRWHKVFEEYIASLPPVEAGATRDELIERHLRILGRIAGRIAWKRCPKSFGIWSKEAQDNLSHVGLVYELRAFGTLGLFVAAERFNPELGAFSTCANDWAKKFVRLYLEEIIGTVPRTGDMGEDKPRRSVMDLINANLDGLRSYRGKAAGGMAMFDGSLIIPGPNPGEKEIEVVGTEGITNPERLDYLQRHVGKKDYPWFDVLFSEPFPKLLTPARLKQITETRTCFGIRRKPKWPSVMGTVHLPGHANGKASDAPASGELEQPKHIEPGPNIVPAEICYLDKRCGRYDSREKFDEVAESKPKVLKKQRTPHWRNGLVFAVEYLRRRKNGETFARRRWCKPTCNVEVWYAALAA